MELGTNIRRYRKEMGLTQEKLAYELGVSLQAVSRWENDITYPDITMLPVIADYFGVTIDELMGRYIECSLSEREQFFKESAKLCTEDKLDEAIKIHKKMLEKYSKDVYIQFSLCNLLYKKKKDENSSEYDDEINWLCHKIERSGEPDMQCGAIRVRTLMHMKNQEFEDAKKLINKLPSYRCGREIMMEKLLKEQNKELQSIWKSSEK